MQCHRQGQRDSSLLRAGVREGFGSFRQSEAEAAQPILEWPPGDAGPGVHAARYLGFWVAAACPALSVLALKWPLWEEVFMI